MVEGWRREGKEKEGRGMIEKGWSRMEQEWGKDGGGAEEGFKRDG
jgi:hypothetical protein